MTAGGMPAADAYDPELGPPPEGPKKMPKIVLGLTFMAVIAGFLFGYDTGVVSGAMLIIREELRLDDFQQELVVSVTVASAAIFALFAGFFNEKFGRKPIIIFSSGLFVIGAIVLAVSPANHWQVLLTGRVIVGAGIGLSSTTVPPYVAETCPPHVRGRMITMFQLMITFGFWIAGILDGIFSYLPKSISWRIMLGVAGIPAALQGVGFFFMPESPRWLATHGKVDEALTVLNRVSGSDKVANYELKAILKGQEKSVKERALLGDQNVLMCMLKTPGVRRALVVGCLLQMFQQLCGVNTVMYYSASIVRMGGASSPQFAIWMAAVISGFNFFCTFIGIYLVEKAGRRLLTLGSVFGVVLTLCVLGTGFALIAHEAPPVSFYEKYNTSFPVNASECFKLNSCDACSYQDTCGFCYTKNNISMTGSCVPIGTAYGTESALYGRCGSNHTDSSENPILNSKTAVWAQGYCPTSVSFLPIIGMVLYLCCFSSGFGPMPWTINAEIYPNWARSAGTAIATSINWWCNLIIALTFLTLAKAISREGAFFLYAGITTFALILFFLFVPETKNKSMEQVQRLFEVGWFQFGKKEPEVRVAYQAGNVSVGGQIIPLELHETNGTSKVNPAFDDEDDNENSNNVNYI